MAASSPSRRARSRLALCVLIGLISAASGSAAEVQQEISFTWPIPLWEVPLFPPDEEDGQEMTEGLAAIAEEGFRDYINDYLPQELKADDRFRQHYESLDHTVRDNDAFLRWQKRCFSLGRRISLAELDWQGPQIPKKTNGVDYAWRALHDSPAFKRLSKNMESQGFQLMKHVNRGIEKTKRRLFVFAEVFRPGDFDYPRVHTGAMVGGVFAARNAESEGMQQVHVVVDSRGGTAPFGRQHEAVIEAGHLSAFPAWTPHFFRPNPSNETNVFFRFLVWNEGGPGEMDWEEDPFGDFTHAKTVRVSPRQESHARTEL